MTDTTTTTAQQIAARYADGMRWWRTVSDTDSAALHEVAASRGGLDVNLSDECREAAIREDWRDGPRTGTVLRYTFADGSVITCAGDAWDFGYSECYCWQDSGHADVCTVGGAF